MVEPPLSPTRIQTQILMRMDTETDYDSLLDTVFHDTEAAQWLLGLDSADTGQEENDDDGKDSISAFVIYSKTQHDLCILFQSTSTRATYSYQNQHLQSPSGFHWSRPRLQSTPVPTLTPTRLPTPIPCQVNPNPNTFIGAQFREADTITYRCHKATKQNHVMMTLTDALLPIYISHQIPRLKSTRLRSIASVTADNELVVSTLYWFQDSTSVLCITKYPLDPLPSLDAGASQLPQMHVLCMDQMFGQGYTLARDARPTSRDVLYSISMYQQQDCPYCLLRGVSCRCTTAALMRMRGQQMRGVAAAGKVGDDGMLQRHANPWEVWKSVLLACESQPRRQKGFVRDPSTGEYEEFECYSIMRIVPERRQSMSLAMPSPLPPSSMMSQATKARLIVPFSIYVEVEQGGIHISSEVGANEALVNQMATEQRDGDDDGDDDNDCDDCENESGLAVIVEPSLDDECVIALMQGNHASSQFGHGSPPVSVPASGPVATASNQNPTPVTKKQNRAPSAHTSRIPTTPEQRTLALQFYNDVFSMEWKAGQSIACHLCGVLYGKKFDMKRHVKAAHLMDRDFVCAECGKRFKRREHLRTHGQVHSTKTDP